MVPWAPSTPASPPASGDGAAVSVRCVSSPHPPRLRIDYSLVVVEDVEDEDEDEVDVPAPSLAVCTPSLSTARQVLGSLAVSSSLSPPAKSGGRPKAVQWLEDSNESELDYASQYREAACQVFETIASPTLAAPREGECPASRTVIRTTKKRRRHRRARTWDTDGFPAVPPPPAV